MDRAQAFFRWPLAVLALASATVFAWRVIEPPAFLDPIASWPWPGGDTWEFIASGLVLRGVPLEIVVRPPLLPSLIALGDASGLLGLVPLFGLVAASAAPVLLAREVAARAGGLTAGAAALALLLCQSWLRHGLEWMADVPAAVLFALAVEALGPADGGPRWIRAGVLGGLGALTTPLAFLLVPLAVGAVVLARPRGTKALRAALGITFLMAMPATWLVVKAALFDRPEDGGMQHWRFFGVHLEGLAPFAWHVLSAWGWPGSLAALAGLFVLARRARERPLELVPLAGLAAVTVFWGVLYGYRAPRFAASLLPLLVLPTALGLVAIPRRGLRIIAACAVVLAAAWPLPGFVTSGSTLPLTPIPPLVLRAPSVSGDSGSAPQLGAASVSWAAPRLSDLAWVAARRRPALPASTVVPGAFDEVAGVLLADSAPERRYEWIRRVAVLVRAPAVRVPRLAVEALPFGPARPLGARGSFAFLRVRSPLGGRDWILATPAGDAPLSFRDAPTDPAELERARAIAALRANRHVIAIVEPGRSWWAWLCFLVPGERLHYVAPEDLASFETFRAGLERLGPVDNIRGLSIEPVKALRRPALVVRAAPGR